MTLLLALSFTAVHAQDDEMPQSLGTEGKTAHTQASKIPVGSPSQNSTLSVNDLSLGFFRKPTDTPCLMPLKACNTNDSYYRSIFERLRGRLASLCYAPERCVVGCALAGREYEEPYSPSNCRLQI